MKIIARSIATAFLVVAVGYYLWHGLTYRGPTDFGQGVLAWVGPQMVAPILALTIVPLVFAFTGDGIMSALTGRNSGRFRDGLVGIGTVRSVRQTGLTVNDQPQLRIELGVEGVDGKVFDTHMTMVVPLAELALLRPGVVLPVRYLPGRTDKVELDRSGDQAAAQRAMNESLIRQGVTTAHKLDIAARGVVAQAVVRALSVPGEIRGGNSKVEVELVVTRPNGTTFVTRSEKFLPPTGVGHVQVGRIVEVRYLPEDENEVVLALPANA